MGKRVSCEAVRPNSSGAACCRWDVAWSSPLSAGSGSSGSSSLFSGVYVAEEVDGVGNKESINIPKVHAQTLLEVFFNMSLRSACFIVGAFF